MLGETVEFTKSSTLRVSSALVVLWHPAVAANVASIKTDRTMLYIKVLLWQSERGAHGKLEAAGWLKRVAIDVDEVDQAERNVEHRHEGAQLAAAGRPQAEQVEALGGGERLPGVVERQQPDRTEQVEV